MTSSENSSSATPQQILASPEFRALVQERRRLWVPVVATIICAYFGFISFVAFAPAALGRTFGTHTVSIGIYAGLALLVLSFLLTALYLRLSNGRINTLLEDIRHKFQ